jgi:hypothetical protein
MISTLYRGKYTCIIEVKPCHDDTTSNEKYEFIYSVVFSATEPSWKGLISVTKNIKGKIGIYVTTPFKHGKKFETDSL